MKTMWGSRFRSRLSPRRVRRAAQTPEHRLLRRRRQRPPASTISATASLTSRRSEADQAKFEEF